MEKNSENNKIVSSSLEILSAIPNPNSDFVNDNCLEVMIKFWSAEGEEMDMGYLYMVREKESNDISCYFKFDGDDINSGDPCLYEVRDGYITFNDENLIYLSEGECLREVYAHNDIFNPIKIIRLMNLFASIGYKGEHHSLEEEVEELKKHWEKTWANY